MDKAALLLDILLAHNRTSYVGEKERIRGKFPPYDGQTGSWYKIELESFVQGLHLESEVEESAEPSRVSRNLNQPGNNTYFILKFFLAECQVKAVELGCCSFIYIWATFLNTGPSTLGNSLPSPLSL